jgi:hypothetical protein
MSVYPAWMEKRCTRTIIIEIPVPGPPGDGGSGGGGGGGGATLVRVEKPIPKVMIKKVIVLDDYENINVIVLRVIDLSFNIGGT